MSKRFLFGLQVALLLLMFGLAVSSMALKSPTFDEQGFLTRGLGYVRGDNRHMRVGHPAGLNALNALLLANDANVQLPTDHPSWMETSFHRPSELFMWERGNDVEKVMFLARLPTVWLGLVLTAVVARWASELTRTRWAGFLALGLVALDPNMLAHSRLATTDLGLTAGATIAGYTLWRYLRQPTWRHVILAGIGFGLLQNSKFTAGLFVPLFALVIFVGLFTHWRFERSPATLSSFTHALNPTPVWQVLFKLIVAYPLVAFFTLWAAYGFEIGTLPPNLPTFAQLSGLTVPLAHHLEQLLDIGGRLQIGTPAFLWGQYSDSGWWSYFLVAFLLKTPLPTLILLLTAVFLLLRRPTLTWLDLAALLIPSLGYFGIALTTDVNLGYRHILPTLPFFIVLIGAVVAEKKLSIVNYWAYLLGGALVWQLVIALTIWPHYLAFFNVFAGGPDGGWRFLVDSNLDWGQDLGGLKTWMVAHDVDEVWLSYFGEGRPAYYEINYRGLDSFPPRLMHPERRPFFPHEPAPGVYAISATNLQGVQFADHAQFAWFRQREPLDKVGYSIFLYEVAATGPPVDLALGSVQLDELTPTDFAQLGSNDVRLYWFDANQSLLVPAEADSWLAVANDAAIPDGLLGAWDRLTRVGGSAEYTLYQVGPVVVERQDALAIWRQGDGAVGLSGVTVMTETAVAGQPIPLTTVWQQRGQPQPTKLFVHLLNEEGELITQWDGLGAAWQSWHSGSTLWQTHTLSLPADMPTGLYQLWAGVYHPETGKRWQTEVGERVFLGEVIVE